MTFDQIPDVLVIRSLDIFVYGLACPRPDPVDPYSQMLGMAKRLLPGHMVPVETKMFGYNPPGRRALRRVFRAFVRREVKKQFPVKVAVDASIAFEDWLVRTNYPESRRVELRQLFEDLNVGLQGASADPEITKVKSFIKDEPYSTWKFPRWINSRSDKWKVLFGPYVKVMEDVVYSHPVFIKHTPVRDRPDVILRDVFREGWFVYAGDWTSMESHHNPWVNCVIINVVYGWLFQNFMAEPKFLETIYKVLGVRDYQLASKFVTAMLHSILCSGEMDTSLRNALLNYFVTLFVYACANNEEVNVALTRWYNYCGEYRRNHPVPDQWWNTHWHTLPYDPPDYELCFGRGFRWERFWADKHLTVPDNFPAKVEGDDSLFSSPVQIKSHFFELMGFNIKLIEHKEISTASFCGNIFDVEEKIIVTDPRETLVNFGWTKKQDVNASQKRLDLLLRSKGYSLLYSYDGCPILTAFASYVLRVTRRAESGLEKFIKSDRTMSLWERDWLLEAIKYRGAGAKPGPRTRALIQDLYDISVKEQLDLEAYFNSLDKVQPILHRIIANWEDNFPVWAQYFDQWREEAIVYRKRKSPYAAFSKMVLVHDEGDSSVTLFGKTPGPLYIKRSTMGPNGVMVPAREPVYVDPRDEFDPMADDEDPGVPDLFAQI